MDILVYNLSFVHVAGMNMYIVLSTYFFSLANFIVYCFKYMYVILVELII